MDAHIVHVLNDLCRDYAPLAWLMRGLSNRTVLIAIGLGSAALMWRQLRPAWLPLLFLLGLVSAVDAVNHHIFKAMIARPRPCHTFESLFTPDGCGTGWSMPSNHAANAFAAATLVTMLLPRQAPWIFVVAFGVALSRVFLGVHYPSDVLAGAIVGTLAAVPVGLLALYLCKRKIRASWRLS